MNEIRHIECAQDELDAVIDRMSDADWSLTHVHHPDYREGVKSWHLFFQRGAA